MCVAYQHRLFPIRLWQQDNFSYFIAFLVFSTIWCKTKPPTSQNILGAFVLLNAPIMIRTSYCWKQKTKRCPGRATIKEHSLPMKWWGRVNYDGHHTRYKPKQSNKAKYVQRTYNVETTSIQQDVVSTLTKTLNRHCFNVVYPLGSSVLPNKVVTISDKTYQIQRSKQHKTWKTPRAAWRNLVTLAVQNAPSETRFRTVWSESSLGAHNQAISSQ